MADALTSIHLVHRGRDVASVASRYLRSGQSDRDAIGLAIEDLIAVQTGARDGRIELRCDGSSAAAASGTVVCDVSNATAGDKLVIRVPGFPPYVLTAVNGSPTYADGEVDMSVGTDSLYGDELVSAVSALPGLKDAVSASNASGTVTLTASRAGVTGNAITVVKAVTTAGAWTITAFSGGAEPGSLATGAVTIASTGTNIAADDTVTIGSVTFTWKASPSGENEVAFVNTTATDAAALAAKINAHSKLQGLVDAEASAGVVTVTFRGDPRSGELVATSRTETNSGSVTWGASALASGSSEAYGADPRTFALGVAS